MIVDTGSVPTLLEALRELAFDLSWCYQHATDEVWNRLDPELWRLTSNAWLVLQSASDSKIAAAAADPAFAQEVQELLAARRRFAGSSACGYAGRRQAFKSHNGVLRCLRRATMG